METCQLLRATRKRERNVEGGCLSQYETKCFKTYDRKGVFMGATGTMIIKKKSLRLSRLTCEDGGGQPDTLREKKKKNPINIRLDTVDWTLLYVKTRGSGGFQGRKISSRVAAVVTELNLPEEMGTLFY